MEITQAMFSLQDGDALEHKAQAVAATSSAEGFARSLSIVAHYFETGEIRKRQIESDHSRVFLHAVRPGSLELVFTIDIDGTMKALAAAGYTLALGMASSAFYDLTKSVYNRILGKRHTPTTPSIGTLASQRPGDLDALADAAQPSIVRAHQIINHGVMNINTYIGTNELAKLDAASKQHVTQYSRSETLEHIIGSVAAYNANTRNGRIFIKDAGKTVPFYVNRNCEVGTEVIISASLQQYTRNPDSGVGTFVVFPEKWPDGRYKKLYVVAASLSF